MIVQSDYCDLQFHLHVQMRYSHKIFPRSVPYAKIFLPTNYIILEIYVESFSWQYTAALRGSYIVDIVSHARLLRRHWSVSVDHWQWRVKTRLRGSGEWRHDCAAVANEARIRHGDISRTIFSRCNGVREYSENNSTAKFFMFTVYSKRYWGSSEIMRLSKTHFHFLIIVITSQQLESCGTTLTSSSEYTYVII